MDWGSRLWSSGGPLPELLGSAQGPGAACARVWPLYLTWSPPWLCHQPSLPNPSSGHCGKGPGHQGTPFQVRTCRGGHIKGLCLLVAELALTAPTLCVSP